MFCNTFRRPSICSVTSFRRPSMCLQHPLKTLPVFLYTIRRLSMFSAIPSEDPHVFCYTFRRPSMCVSTLDSGFSAQTLQNYCDISILKSHRVYLNRQKHMSRKGRDTVIKGSRKQRQAGSRKDKQKDRQICRLYTSREAQKRESRRKSLRETYEYCTLHSSKKIERLQVHCP